MWSNLLSSGEAAKERLASKLKETNDALSQRASAHAQKVKSQSNSASNSATTSPVASPSASVSGADSKASNNDVGVGVGSGVVESAGAGSDNATNKTGTSFSFPTFGVGGLGLNLGGNNKNDSNSNSNSNNNSNSNIATTTTKSTTSPKTSIFSNLNQPEVQNEIFDSLKLGWGNVVEVTKNVAETTKAVVEKEQTRIQASLFSNGPYVRDLSLPLDSDSLRDAEVVYLTDRLITMGHPAMQSPTNGDITPNRKLASVAHLLKKRHGGKFMVWNLSELEYDYSQLQDQVMTFQFPGSPSPPLGLMLKILLSVESWLKADERNVAVMHCLTGRGRTSTVMAAFLCWMGEAGFEDDPNKALEYIAHCKRMESDALTIPSQRRYVSYFKNMMDGVRPNQPPILLKRIIMSEAPKFGKNSQRGKNDDSEDQTKPQSQLGCAPYLQIFKAGKLVFTTAASKSYNQSKDDLPFCLPSDGSITFPVETIVQGDILIRCRHLTRKGQRVSMFRAAFHTGYTPPKVLRLTKAQLDGACNDKRYVDDFFIDLIFEECSAAMASKHLLSSSEKEMDNSDGGTHVKFAQDTAKTDDNVHNEASARRMGATISGSQGVEGGIVSASAYDSMLHRDSRFWDVISERRETNRKRITSGSFDIDERGESTIEAETAPFYGATIGRRREFPNEGKSDKSSADGTYESNEVASHRSIQSFSIGGEMDFTVDDETKPEVSEEPIEEISSPKEAKKDDLMDALMAIDDDEESVEGDEHEEDLVVEDLPEDNGTDTDSEEIVFGTESEETGDDAVPEEESKEATEQNDAEEQEKADTDVDVNADTDATEEQVQSSEIESTKSKSSCDASLVKIDALDLEDDSGEFDFDDDDDDEEMQDLENFLTNAKS